MKYLLLLAGLAGAPAAFAQTTPATQPASGTKNVGRDRADAPQAPGMSSTASTQAATGTAKEPATRQKPAKAKRPKQ